MKRLWNEITAVNVRAMEPENSAVYPGIYGRRDYREVVARRLLVTIATSYDMDVSHLHDSVSKSIPSVSPGDLSPETDLRCECRAIVARYEFVFCNLLAHIT